MVDGTKTTATFDFVGVQGQNMYLSSKEMMQRLETTFTTKDIQQAVLDLSGLTGNRERNGLTFACSCVLQKKR